MTQLKASRATAASAHLGILGRVVDRGGEEEGVVAAGDGRVVAAFPGQVGAEHLQGAELLQVLEVGVGRAAVSPLLVKRHTMGPSHRVMMWSCGCLYRLLARGNASSRWRAGRKTTRRVRASTTRSDVRYEMNY